MVCVQFHDATVRAVASKRVQCDEVWSFCYAKQKNVATAKTAPEGAGDVWTWTALDADTKLILSWAVGGRDAGYAFALMDDLRGRLANRVQLTTDGHKAYLQAVEEAFGADIDYGMLVKLYGAETDGQGHERKYSLSECRRAQGYNHRQPRSQARLDELHRAAQSHHADEHAALHAADERVQQESREPLPRAGALLRVLQLRSPASDLARVAGDGGRRV